MSEFNTPEFLQNRSVEDFHQLMKTILPTDIDLSEGGHGWNLTRPTALVAAEISEFILPEVVKLIFPEWSYGEFLDGHAKSRGITRRAATAATGELTITGAINTVIPAGSLFSTASVNDVPSVDYMTLEEAVIPEAGSITVDIQCTQTGTVGNTAKQTIILVAGKISGISAVINEADVTGGTEEEDDDSLKNRIGEYDKSQGDNFVGSPADYKRWAKSVPGVGEVTVIPAQDDSGIVTLVLTDANGLPATQVLQDRVYNYIMRPDDPGERLTNPNARLVVTAPATMAIGVMATIELTDGATLESVKNAFISNLSLYLPEAMEQKEVKLTRVASALSSTAGVNDFDTASLKIGVKIAGAISYGTENIPIEITQLPTVEAEDLVFTSGTV